MAASTSHFASTPPPSPPRASTSTLRVDSGTRHPCKPARDPVAPAIEAVRVADDLDALEARAQGRGMRVLAAQPAADALLRIDPGHGIGAQRVARVPHAQRRAAGQADAGMVAGADVLVHAVAHAQHPLACREPARLLRTNAALALQLALALGDDHLEPRLVGRQRLGERLLHLAGPYAVQRAPPSHAHTQPGLLYRALA